MLRRSLFVRGVTLALCTPLAVTARAGVMNPDISVIGQPFMRWTDDAADPDSQARHARRGRDRVRVRRLPQSLRARQRSSRRSVEEGIELEEGYFTAPARPARRPGAQGRQVPRRLRQAEPAASARLSRSRSASACWPTYLPGDESFNETGLQRLGAAPARRRRLAHRVGRLAAGRHVPHRARVERRAERSADHRSREATVRASRARRARTGLGVRSPIGDRSGSSSACPATAGHQQRRGRDADHGVRRRRSRPSCGPGRTPTCWCRPRC